LVLKEVGLSATIVWRHRMYIEIIPNPTKDDVWYIRKQLQEFNLTHLEVTEDKPFVLFAKDDESGERIGGISCTIFGQWIDIDSLWVREDQRGKGIGSALLERSVERARKAGCTNAWVNTFSFQSPEFYLKHGFEKVFEQANYPKTSSRTFLVREIEQLPGEDAVSGKEVVGQPGSIEIREEKA
ncbi:MAG: GNAT family N-acetyltransferase, partial [Spirochaetaceae bacterium]